MGETGGFQSVCGSWFSCCAGLIAMSDVPENTMETSFPECCVPTSEFLLDDVEMYCRNLNLECQAAGLTFSENEILADIDIQKDSFYENGNDLPYKNMPHPVESLPDLEFNYFSLLSESLQMDSYKYAEIDDMHPDGDPLLQELTPLVESIPENDPFQTVECSLSLDLGFICEDKEQQAFPPLPETLEDITIDGKAQDVVATCGDSSDSFLTPCETEIIVSKSAKKKNKHKRGYTPVTVDDLDELRVKRWLEPIPVPPRRVRDPRPHEFLLRMLRDECYQLINWEDRNRGIFRLVDEKLVSKIWGKRRTKNRTVHSKDLKYDHFARNIRYHYHKDFLPVKEQKVYQFTPKILKAWEAGNLHA